MFANVLFLQWITCCNLGTNSCNQFQLQPRWFVYPTPGFSGAQGPQPKRQQQTLKATLLMHAILHEVKQYGPDSVKYGMLRTMQEFVYKL